MALKLQVEKLEEIEEPLRPLYEEKDGKFQLSLADPLPEDATPYKKTIDSLRKVERERGKEIEKWKSLNLAPEEITQKLEHLQELEELKLAKNNDFEQFKETFKSQWLEKNEERIKKAEQKAAQAEAERVRIQGEREQDRLEVLIDRAIIGAKGKPRALKPIVKQFVRVEHQDGQAKFVVYDENGSQWYNTKTGDPLTIPELLSEMVQLEDYADLFEGSGNSGGGARPGSGGPTKGPPLGFKSKKDFGVGPAYAKNFEAYNKAFSTPEEALKAYHALPDG